MKSILLLYLIIPTLAIGQNAKRFPFQVLDSRNASYKKKELKRFDYLGKSKVILNDGDLYIVHFTGLPFHIKGDTVVDLKTLNDQLQDLNMLESKRPNLNYFFSNKGTVPGMIHDSYPIILIPPPRARNPISHNVDDPLYLKWPEGLGKATITVKNMFDDSLKSFETDSSSFSIESEELRLLSQLEPILIVQLILSNSFLEKYRSADVKAFELLQSSAGHTLYKANFTEAIEAVMLAYYFEMAMLQVEAEKYYRLATTLSDNQVFKEALRFYLNRKQ